MRTILFLLGASALATPAFAQHSGHAAPAEPAAQQPAAATDPSCPPEHAAMGHCSPKAARTANGEAPGIADPPAAPPSAAALSGPRNAADRVYGADAMAVARAVLRREHGNIVTSKVLIDRLEVGVRQGRESYAWNVQGWYGGDIDRLWVKSQGEPDTAEVQALYSRAIDPWFNLQAGVRQDLASGPDRTHLVLGIQGLAPYWFEVDGSLFLSTKGDLTGRLEAEYDQRLTRKLILQPSIEFDLAAQDVPELGIGAGLSTAEAALRLRYAFVPEFAPYIGIQYARAFGRTRDLARARGDDQGGFSFLVGVRTWF